MFGGLKAGSGLILDMGGPVRPRSVTVTFGSESGADVEIEVGDDGTLAASALPAFTTVAAADGVGGTHTFRAARAVSGRYVLIWFTKLPPDGPGRFQGKIFNVVIHGSPQPGSAPGTVISDLPPGKTLRKPSPGNSIVRSQNQL